MLFFDKLNFSRTVSLFRGFKNYMSLSQHRTGSEVNAVTPQPSPGPDPVVERTMENPVPNQSKMGAGPMESVKMDLTSIAVEMPLAASPQNSLFPVVEQGIEDMK